MRIDDSSDPVVLPKRVASRWSIGVSGTSRSGDGDTPDRDIRLLKNPDGQWTTRDLRAEVTAQGGSQSAVSFKLTENICRSLRGTQYGADAAD